MDSMTRSEVAERTGVNSETLRYYEERGLIPDPPRSASGYRLYDESYVRRLRFIGRAKQLGFTLEEIKSLLELRAGPDATCQDVKARAEEKVSEVQEKMADLRRIKSALASLVEMCDGGDGPTGACPILDAMQDEEAFGEAVA